MLTDQQLAQNCPHEGFHPCRGPKACVNGPTACPELSGPKARSVLNRLLVRSHSPEARLSCRCVRNGYRPRPCEFLGFGAIDVTKPYEIILLCDVALSPMSSSGLGRRSCRSHRHITDSKFRIVVETHRNRPRIARNRCVPICGHRAGFVGRGLAQL